MATMKEWQERERNREDLKEHLNWMLGQIKEGIEPEHFYNNYMSVHRKSECLRSEDKRLYTYKFNDAIARHRLKQDEGKLNKELVEERVQEQFAKAMKRLVKDSGINETQVKAMMIMILESETMRDQLKMEVDYYMQNVIYDPNNAGYDIWLALKEEGAAR